jgi:hypothetical protein
VSRVIEHAKAHYEVLEVELGLVYRWCPESVVIECNCGERLTLTASRTTCGVCGAEHASIAQEVLEVRPEDKGDHPWRSLKPYYTPTRERRLGKMRRPNSSWYGCHDHPIWTQMPPDRCKHKLMSIVPVVPVRVEGGYASRCLLCGTVGPVRGNGQAARRALLERGTRNEE